MQKSNAPTKLTVAFASGTGAGPVNNVPLTPGATPGTASYQTGFTTVNMEPIASGGIPPFGADFNGLFQAATTAQIWQQSGYMWPYDSAFASNANINGYPAGSVLAMASGKGFWLNQTDNNSTNPDATGSSGWVGFPAAGVYTINTTGGTTTPDPSTLGVPVLVVTGALTSNAVIVLPLTAGKRWIIANATTGSYTLTVQGPSGTGTSIPQSTHLLVWTDGFSFYAVDANISGQYLPINGTAVAATKLATARAFSITGFATAAGVNFDGTGNVTLNVTALNVPSALGYTPANDASVVHTAGSETITGAKTFAQPVPSTYNVTSVSSPQNMAFRGSGGFGGGFGMYSGTYGAATYITGSGSITMLNFALGSNTAISPVATLDSTGAFSTVSGTFSGTVTATGGFQVSDRRIKKNIRKRKVQRGFALKVAMLFSEWDRIADGVHDVGLIAQSLKRIASRYVIRTRGKRGILAIDKAGVALEASMDCALQLAEHAKEIKALRKALERMARK